MTHPSATPEPEEPEELKRPERAEDLNGPVESDDLDDLGDIGDMVGLDPGLAGERTELAWTRTAISFAALGGVVFRSTPLPGVLIVGMSGLIFVLGRLSRPTARTGGHERRRALATITAAVTFVSALALATVVLPLT